MTIEGDGFILARSLGGRKKREEKFAARDCNCRRDYYALSLQADLPSPLSLRSLRPKAHSRKSACARSAPTPASAAAAASRNRVQTAPCAANRPAWPRRTSEEEEGEARRPPNENQGKRRRRSGFSGLGSNRGLFCQCSLVHEVGKSWCERQEKEKKKTEESSSFGRRRGRGLRWGSDTAPLLL